MENTATDTAAFPDAIQDETLDTEPPPERETFMHLVEVAMSDEDTGAQKNRLVEVDRKILAVEAEKAGAVSDFNKELKDLRKERVAILDVIGTGKERKQIACYEERDDRRGHMLTRRVDTDEIVDERPLSASEREPTDDRQGDLFANGEGADQRTPEQIAEDAEESGRLIRTTSAEARERRRQREAGPDAGETEPEPDELADDDEHAPDSEDSDEEGDDVA